MPSYLIQILVIALSLPLALVFSTVATALTTVSSTEISSMKRHNVPGSASLEKVISQRGHYLDLAVLLRILCETIGIVASTILCFEIFQKSGTAIAVAIVSVTIVVFLLIEVFSRTLGKNNPYTILLKSAGVLRFFNVFFGGITSALVWLGKLLSGSSQQEDDEDEDHARVYNEEELKEAVDKASASGIVDADEREMIQSVIDLNNQSARSVMVPRTEMIWIEEGKTAGQAVNLCVRSGHSRLPVIGEDVDDIVGVVYLKDLIGQTYSSKDNGRSVHVRDVMRVPKFVPDSRRLDDLLEDMQREQIHLAILVDEYGAVAGVVSMEDILEEIVGEIVDEYDTAEIQPFEQREPEKFRASSRLSLAETEEYLQEYGYDIHFSDEEKEEVETLYGLAAYILGRVPLPGAVFSTAGLSFISEGGRDRRGRLKINSFEINPEPTELLSDPTK